MRSAASLVLLLPLAAISACQPDDEISGHDAGRRTGTDAGATPIDGGADATAFYSGVVLAKATQGADGGTYMAFADFVEGQIPTLESLPAGSCSCTVDVGAGLVRRPPDVGTITVAPIDLPAASAPAPLATLTPFGPSLDFPGGQGTADLGPDWFVTPGGYPYADSLAWSPGSSLAVSAPGHDAPGFSAAILTGAPLAGVTPSFDGPPLAIDRSQPFQVTWTPDQTPNELVMLTIRQIAASAETSCFCVAADTAGDLILGADVVSQYATNQVSCLIELERFTLTTVTNESATIELVGATALQTRATFQ
ncbi:MAG TPA: hypothetical protein VI456_11940 [Polyangia bacterium]